MSYIAPGARVLLVEDNEINMEMAIELLEPLQLNLDTATDGAAALEKVTGGEYDLVLMDYLMPVMNGKEATIQIRKLPGKNKENLPIVALTASPEASAELLEAGMNDFLIKPINPQHVVDMLAKYAPLLLVEEGDLSEKESPVETVPVIDGIDTGAAIGSCGSVGLLRRLLGDYARVISIKAAKIRDFLDKGDLDNFRIEVHALKSASRVIGALGLSDQFEALEKAARESDMDFIFVHAMKCLDEYESYKQKLSEFTSLNGGSQAATDEQIINLLKRLQRSAECFYLDGVDAQIRELEKCVLPAECKEHFQNLIACVSDVAMEDVMRISGRMISFLQERLGHGEKEETYG